METRQGNPKQGSKWYLRGFPGEGRGLLKKVDTLHKGTIKLNTRKFMSEKKRGPPDGGGSSDKYLKAQRKRDVQ